MSRRRPGLTEALRFAAMSAATFGLAIPAIAVAAFDRGGRRSSAIVGSWARLVLRLAGVEVLVEGRENLPEGGGYLLTSTHASLLDVPILYSLLPAESRFLAKRELFGMPLFGQAIRLLGFVPIDRADRKNARSALERAGDVAGGSRALVVFPEGRRSRDGSLLPFKKGAFALAVERELAVVPVAILGSAERLAPGDFRARPGPVRVRVGAPFLPGGEEHAHRTRLARAVRAEIERLLQDGPGAPAAALSTTSPART